MTKNEEVYEIFKDYFGEDKVDLQNDIILVYFPKITIINEHDKSHEIKELFVKVQINNGYLIGTFTMNRTEYTSEEFAIGYMHSHCTSLDKEMLGQFKNPCLGTGPIKGTCLTLNATPNEEIWQLFCVELDKYVVTESLKGIPYIRMESIGATNNSKTYPDDMHMNVEANPLEYEGFTKYFLANCKLKFAKNGRSLSIAMSGYEWIMYVSNMFIQWANTHNKVEFAKSALNIAKEKNRCFYAGSDVTESAENVVICKFKGVEQRVRIKNKTEHIEENSVRILSYKYCGYLASKVLNIINYHYGRKSFIKELYSREAIHSLGENICVL